MRRIFSVAERKKVFSFQISLLKEDLENTSIMIEKGKMRGAYIFLFDALERLFDCYFSSIGFKPSTRRDREELMINNFSFLILRKFRNFYYERRGGMYEEPLFISSSDVKRLFKFLKKMIEEINQKLSKKYRINSKVERLVKKLSSMIE